MITLTPPQGADRRRHPRLQVQRPAKFRPTSVHAFSPAATINLSASGALIETTCPRQIDTNDEIELVIAWDNEPIVPRACSVIAHVRRTRPLQQGSTAIAVEFCCASLSDQIDAAARRARTHTIHTNTITPAAAA